MPTSKLRVNPQHPVVHHEQESPDDCGRACAQMMITSLLHPKMNQAAGAAVTIIGQDKVRELEGGDPDPLPNQAGWFTTPMDLVRALNHKDNGLDSSRHQWRIAVTDKDKQHELLAEIALSMKVHGTPAAIVTTIQDHWRVVVGIDIGLTSTVLHLDDPDALVSAHGRPGHFYFDACQKKPVVVGDQIVETMVRPDVFAFGGLDLTIEPIPGLLDSSGFDGKAVAVVFGDPKTDAPAEHAELVEQFKHRREPNRGEAIPLAACLTLGEGRWIDRLRLLVGDVEDPELGEFCRGLALVTTPRIVLRLEDGHSHGDGGIPDAYVIVGGFADEAGVVAVFDKRSEGLLLAARWVANREDVTFLNKKPGEQLFWTPTRRTRSPTVPFTMRTEGNRRIAKRLTDGFEFDLPPVRSAAG